jgi:hypothetical protein
MNDEINTIPCYSDNESIGADSSFGFAGQQLKDGFNIMENAGWIKLYRKSFDNFLYKENRPLTRREAWENMLLLVNYEDNNILIGNQLFECKRGQSILSIDSWSRIFHWNASKTRRFFNLLQSCNMIRSESVKKSTRITICNYDIYQGDRRANDEQTTSKRRANDEQTTTTKEGKKLITKEIKKFIIPQKLEIEKYFSELKAKNGVADAFFDYYTSNGWLVGGQQMYDWRAAARNWLRNETKYSNNGKSKRPPGPDYNRSDFD